MARATSPVLLFPLVSALLVTLPPRAFPETVVEVYQPVLGTNAIRIVAVPYRVPEGMDRRGVQIEWTCRQNSVLDPDGGGRDINLASMLGLESRIIEIRSPSAGVGFADTFEVELDLSGLGEDEAFLGVPVRSIVSATRQALLANGSGVPGASVVDLRVIGNEAYAPSSGIEALRFSRQLWSTVMPLAEREVKSTPEIYGRARLTEEAVGSAAEGRLVLLSEFQILNFENWPERFEDEFELFPTRSEFKPLRPDDLVTLKELLLGDHEFEYGACSCVPHPSFAFVLRGRCGTLRIPVFLNGCTTWASVRGDEGETVDVPLNRDQSARLRFVLDYFPEDRKLAREFEAR